MTDDTQSDEEQTMDRHANAIEASFGPISVYVAGSTTDDVEETFDHVWETMMNTSETMHDMKDEMDDGPQSGPTFGD
jgi:hypothetical protein